jgi:hypothetical protein
VCPKCGTATAIHVQTLLEDANPAERAKPLSALPAPVRDIGRPRHNRHISRVRAA